MRGEGHARARTEQQNIHEYCNLQRIEKYLISQIVVNILHMS